jgi:hypothetical protein
MSPENANKLAGLILVRFKCLDTVLRPKSHSNLLSLIGAGGRAGHLKSGSKTRSIFKNVPKGLFFYGFALRQFRLFIRKAAIYSCID